MIIGGLQESGWPQTHPMELFVDSGSTIAVAESVNRLSRSLHLSRRVYFLRESEVLGFVKLLKVAGTRNPTDPLTKAVKKNVYFLARNVWMNCHVLAP